ncbi:PEP-utilizing enzyme [Vibrio lentus]|nr:PEP-utilizing enzyme [Vibrio lentus]
MASTASFTSFQARPETVCSQSDQNVIERYELNNKADVLVEGRAIGQRIALAPPCRADSLDQMSLVQEGDVLVTDMTDPDWEPVMKKSLCDCHFNRGGRTCHAAIIARELGGPCNCWLWYRDKQPESMATP